jgi:TetR/AcrR family transcriptional regulator, transcriptional repressor for nem operon
MKKSEATRRDILEKAFGLIYTKGYQTTSIDDIIATTQVTKGAFFYHFKTKDEMGVAIVKEILKPAMFESFVQPIKNAQDPIKDIYNMTEQLLFGIPFLQVQYGCPAGNLTQEMTPWNTEFSRTLAELINAWQHTLQECINNGKKNGHIRPNVDTEQVVYFLMSSYWGIRNFGKLYNSNACYHAYLKELKQYLNNLQ